MGPLGWLRWGWRQLTSMRTALILLFLVAVASIPGSILPQRGIQPEKVAQYYQDNATRARWLDRFSLFDVFAAPWFAAIYILLFISLAGCVIPRLWKHYRAMRARPPAAPRHLTRLPQSATYETDATPQEALDRARELLRGRRFRVDAGEGSVAAEKGHLGETGNLIFHLALLVLLFAVGVGAAFGYRGNVLLTEGTGFSNTLTSYDAFKPGREFTPGRLAPFSMTLDDFQATYVTQGPQRGQPVEFLGKVRYRTTPSSPERPYDLRVNHPLEVGGAKVYLLGRGYAPTFTVRDGKGQIAFEGAVPFLPMEQRTFTSEGVIKVPDAQPKQLGFIGVFWPTAVADAQGKAMSAFPGAANPMVALQAFAGDLGLDSGTPQSVYKLEGIPDRLKPMKNEVKPLRVGETLTLPDGAGSITFTGHKEWISLAVNDDPGRLPALAAAVIAILGIATSFLVRRRRVWVRARAVEGGHTVVEVGGLTLGNPTAEFDEIVERLREDAAARSRSSGGEAVPAGTAPEKTKE
ncbi:cytochrome c biogenesis protein ResB [Actinomadura alba]|uniref:Cytochrome c biogenesis protein ResB n=1 Tax=Actinomadura alba TaxID=406431 RepID=A0ABR7LW15_9ACTN|nr:cytochrome c biogenesis protein ResB [Actinomadura alba]MBC6469028.1 cytochrome c biogenesis protein ResB [Actinomadura alba]